MSEENTKTVRLMESFITYECRGDIKLNLDIFPELKDKTDDEIQNWLNSNFDNLYVNGFNHELRKDCYYVYSQEEWDEMTVNGEDPEIDADVIELSEYWSNTEVVWDKIKNEEKNMFIQ
jgi:hypothetical protein